jgi:LuxR family maltose regulon positive regulatory protein
VETSLLTTKLNIPPLRPQLVSRPRLFERLNEGLSYNLLLISAPAGFGKTTLLSEWVRQNQPDTRAAWLSLDGGDDDPVRFWSYFIAALQTIQPACGEKILPLLRSSQPPTTEPMLTVLINDLSYVRGDFIAVLDDYHFIESGQIHSGISYLIEHMPVQMHLVISSRADPPLPLASYRGKGMMLEISTDDLRFSVEDATDLLKELKILDLPVEDVTALNERTEGWAVGLKMAALSMSEQKDIRGFITSFTGSQRYVMDYLMEEVLQKQNEEARDFLLKTSILERLSGPLCDAVTGQKGSQDILLELEHGHLFIIPLDESRQWYRYEHLFADLLRHQCETAYKTEQVAPLHRQASQWYEDNNLPYEAIHHALAAQDWENAAKLLNKHGKEKQVSGEFVTLLNWLQQLPEEVLLVQPRLCLLYNAALQMTGSLDAADSILETLERVAQGDDNLMGEIVAHRAHIAWRWFDYQLAGELANKALSLLHPDELENRSVMNNILGYLKTFSGDTKDAETLLTKAYEAAQQTGNYFAASSSLGGLFIIAGQRGELRRMSETAHQAIEFTASSPASGVPHIILSIIFYEWNDLEAALEHIKQVIELSQLIGTMQARVWVHDILACIELARGNDAGFLKASERADFEARNIVDNRAPQAEHAAYRIQFALRQDDLATASEWGSKLAANLDALQARYSHVPVRLLIAQGKKLAATEKLQVLYDGAAESKMQGLMIIYRVYQSLAVENEESAVEFLSNALTMAEPEGYIRTFVDEGKLLKPLLEKALSKGITPEYTRKLIDIIEAEERQKRRMKREEGAPSRSVLSGREIEVLKLMAEGLSNQQIADRLIISLGTVKNHVHNIIEKLEAKGRTQAVAQARELELI